MTFKSKNIIIYLDIYRNTISEVINLGMSETLKAISDPVRREILELLKDGRKTAGEISNSFNLTGATVSYHLSNLKKANLCLLIISLSAYSLPGYEKALCLSHKILKKISTISSTYQLFQIIYLY